MLVKAEQKYIRMSPRKIKLVVDAIRGLSPHEALDQLRFMRKRAAEPVRKTIQQALANAVNNRSIARENLRFLSIEVKKGPTFKRWRAVSRGRAHPIMKRTSHIKVSLEEVQASEPRGASQQGGSSSPSKEGTDGTAAREKKQRTRTRLKKPEKRTEGS